MYNFKDIESKWQKYWDNNSSFKAANGGDKPKYYVLIEFPYPSGVGLHIGHPRSYTALDSLARKRRLEGYNVLFPMGWDAFGLPAENYAIKNHIHPRDAVKQNVAVFKKQLKNLGISFDWNREFSTTDPEYFKWTQWQFIKFFEHGLAYKDKKAINWCISCKVGLSNEEVEHGHCERCGGQVVKREKEQWMLRMKSYSEKLIGGLDDTNFIDRVKIAQINWIGKSEGAEVDFAIDGSSEQLKVYTTRPDTIFGVTFMVLAPEHPVLDKLKDMITNYDDVKNYQYEASKKSEFERVELSKEKTGVKLNGISAINPLNNSKIEIWISDYVMMNYGTGAIMAVPAHDERDYEFAKKFDIPIIEVIERETGEKRDNEEYRKSIVALVKDPKTDKYLTINWGPLGGRLLIGGGLEENEDAVKCALREITEETGYTDLKYLGKTSTIHHHYFAFSKNKARYIDATGLYFELESDNRIEQQLALDEQNKFTVEWVSKDVVEKEITDMLHKAVYNDFAYELPYTGDGIMVNSSFLNGINNKKESIAKMISYLEEKGLGKKTVNYRLQDWVFSRQRFWGEPIPMINCDSCGWVPVPDNDLPVMLPDVAQYEPTDNGESPLANMPEWYTVPCPKCGKQARRETDTMPNWAGSSWYWLRYMDPHNKDAFVSKEALEYWGKVDWYNGGMEHATRHLLYARFWHRFLYDIGLVPTKEPFNIRTAHGMILGENGEKISKSKGNGINPNEIVDAYGADTLRAYEMFIGDYETDTAWSTNGLKGCKRFLDRLWNIQDKVVEGEAYSISLEASIHKTIKKVGNDIENMKYNTAVSALMTLLNEFDKEPTITKADLRTFITLLNPIAPHITEEINEAMKLGNPLCTTSWPTYDEAKTIDDEFEMIIQVNGKVRGRIIVAANISEAEMKEKALSNDTASKYLEGSDIVKVITVPHKLVNIVVK